MVGETNETGVTSKMGETSEMGERLVRLVKDC